MLHGIAARTSREACIEHGTRLKKSGVQLACSTPFSIPLFRSGMPLACCRSLWHAIGTALACQLPPRAVRARNFSMVSCHGYAACRDGMPPSKLFPETLIKNTQNNFQMTTADFPADHRKPNRASRSLRAFLRKIARDVHTATVDFPARNPLRNYSPRERTTLLNSYVHCHHSPTPHSFAPLGVPATPAHFWGGGQEQIPPPA